jgi:hypothetical protein
MKFPRIYGQWDYGAARLGAAKFRVLECRVCIESLLRLLFLSSQSSMKIVHSLKPAHHIGGLTISLIATIGFTTQAQANTLAQSSAAAELFNFSHRPQAGDAQTFQDAIALGTPGRVGANAFADAEFFTQQGDVTGNNLSISTASGTGGNYLAQAESSASVTGFDFSVAANESFSFDWRSLLRVEATSDRPTEERSLASGLFGFAIYTRDQANQLQLVDTLNLFGSDDGTRATLFDLNATSGFRYTPTQTANQVALNGRYTKAVTQATKFTVFELKRNQVSVSAPEPTLAIALFGVGAWGVARKRQRA